MKIAYEDTQIEALEAVLNQIRVTGIQQARLLTMAGQIVQNGEKLEEKVQTRRVKKEVK